MKQVFEPGAITTIFLHEAGTYVEIKNARLPRHFCKARRMCYRFISIAELTPWLVNILTIYDPAER
jgi:hypothetical protein